MTLTELKAWIDANVFTSNNRLNTGTSFREVLNKVADETFGKVETMIGATALKTPLVTVYTPKGIEIWGTNGTGLGFSNDYLEASIKTVNTGGASPEMEFWDVFAGTTFAWRDGAGRTERMRLKNGLLSVRPSGVAAVNADVGLIVGHLDGTSGIQLDSWADAGKQVYLKNWNGKFELVAKNGINLRTDGTFAEDINFLTGADVRLKIAHNGNLIVGGLADNNMAKLQTPSISLGVDFWHTSSDGQQRLYYQNNGNSYYSTPSNAVNVLRFGASEHYLISKSSFAHYFDGTSDWVHGPTTASSASNRVWTHRKEVNNVDYRFFDWNGSTARDWWNVYASTQKMSVAQIIHFNYGVNVGIGTSTPDNRAILDLASTERGLLLPRLTTAQRDAQTGWQNGTIIYNTSIPAFQGRVNGAWVNL